MSNKDFNIEVRFVKSGRDKMHPDGIVRWDIEPIQGTSGQTRRVLVHFDGRVKHSVANKFLGKFAKYALAHICKETKEEESYPNE